VNEYLETSVPGIFAPATIHRDLEGLRAEVELERTIAAREAQSARAGVPS
jgi:hypothetical protein